VLSQNFAVIEHHQPIEIPKFFAIEKGQKSLKFFCKAFCPFM
jgi:hypothetical protein